MCWCESDDELVLVLVLALTSYCGKTVGVRLQVSLSE